LIDERAIRSVLLRYARGIDRMDRDLVRSCYHRGATDEHGSFSGTVDEYLVWVWRVLSRYDMTMHYLTNIAVEFDPSRPGQARSEAYGMSVHTKEGGDPHLNLVIGFRFVDDFALRPVEDGAPEWRIIRRIATSEWCQQVTPELRWPIPAGMRTGERSHHDPIFAPWPDPQP
jgi:hypothetical protein